MVSVSCSRKFTERKLLHTAAESYTPLVYRNLLKKNHTVAEWYIRLIHRNSWNKTVCPTLLLNGTYISHLRKLTKENGLLYTVAEWYIRLIHENSLRKWFAPRCYRMLCTVCSRKFTERKRFSLHCCWIVPRVHNICMVESVCSKKHCCKIHYIDKELCIDKWLMVLIRWTLSSKRSLRCHLHACSGFSECNWLGFFPTQIMSCLIFLYVSDMWF